MIMNLKVLIGIHSGTDDKVPHMDQDTMNKAMTMVDMHDGQLFRVMTEGDWYWWRLCEHVREIVKPTVSVRDWMKLDPGDEEEVRVMECCEMERGEFGKGCVEGELRMCNRVSELRVLISINNSCLEVGSGRSRDFG